MRGREGLDIGSVSASTLDGVAGWTVERFAKIRLVD